MKNKQDISKRERSAAVGLVVCFVAMIAIVGLITFRPTSASSCSLCPFLVLRIHVETKNDGILQKFLGKRILNYVPWSLLTTSEFFSLDTISILGLIILCLGVMGGGEGRGQLFCESECRAASMASTHYMSPPTPQL